MRVGIHERCFFPVEVSKLTVDDTFMKYEPCDEFERKLKNDLHYVITSKMKDFYCSKEAPLLSDIDDEIITFENDDVIYRGSYQFWNQLSKRFCKEKNSRIGTRFQHSAYLGTVIKQIVNCGMSVEQAWKEIHDIENLYHLIKETQQYQSVNISFYGKKDKLLRDDRGIINRVRIILKTGILERGYFIFSDKTNGYYNLYKYWFGDTGCVPWIVYDVE